MSQGALWIVLRNFHVPVTTNTCNTCTHRQYSNTMKGIRYFRFYPQKGTVGGPIAFTYFLFCVIKRICVFQLTSEGSPFWYLNMCYCDMTCRTDGRLTKVSFTVLHTWWASRTCIYILKYILINCHQHFYAFHKFWPSWGWLSKCSYSQHVSDFSNFCSFFLMMPSRVWSS